MRRSMRPGWPLASRIAGIQPSQTLRIIALVEEIRRTNTALKAINAKRGNN
jgi:hypothetical protein